MRVFVRDDAGYLEWVKANPNGFVLNTCESQESGYIVLHKASCGTIRTAKRSNYTSGTYVKLCALDPRDLSAWAHAEDRPQPAPCQLCRPDPDAVAAVTDDPANRLRGFENWIRGYQNFYEPIVLAHFQDLGFEATKNGSAIEKRDLLAAADKLDSGRRKCELHETGEIQAFIAALRKRTRILTDGLVRRPGPDGKDAWYSLECKSWGGFCSSADTLRHFMGTGGLFMLVDEIHGKPISGSVLVIGGSRPPKHDELLAEIKSLYGTEVEAHYLDEIFQAPGLKARAAIHERLHDLDVCVKSIRQSLEGGNA